MGRAVRTVRPVPRGAEPAAEPIRLAPGRVLRWTAVAIAVLLLLSVLSQVALYLRRDLPGLDTVAGVLWADSEQSLPTMFSVGLLLSCAIALRVVARRARQVGERDARRWDALSWIFLYLAFDEALSLHESLIDPVRDGLGLSGVLYYAWVVPAAFAVLVVAVVFLPFVMRLPRTIQLLSLVAAAMYVGGAIGLELLATNYVLDGADRPRADLLGDQGLGYLPYSTTEEALEMGGAALFLYAALRYLRDHLGGGQFVLSVSPGRATR